jgi:hypothetical protein
MDAQVRTGRLRIAVRVVSLYFLLFIPWIILIAMELIALVLFWLRPSQRQDASMPAQAHQ